MARGKTVKYVNKERLEKIPEQNIKEYDRYLRTFSINNPETKDTTLKAYRSYMNIFMCWLAEEYPDMILISEDFTDEAVEIMEDFISFCQEKLNNNAKAINVKLSTVSSFFFWAVKRGRKVDGYKINAHPFDKKIDRVKDNGKKIISEHFLERGQVQDIRDELAKTFDEDYDGDYDPIDTMIFYISYDSACRIGATSKLTMSSLVMDDEKKTGYFNNIREKRAKYVDIPFGTETYELMKKYLAWREAKGIDSDAFFPYLASKQENRWEQMSAQSLARRIKAIGYIIEIEDFRPHSIRKTRLNHVAEKDIRFAKILANHDSMETTEKFYTKQDSAKDVFDKIEGLM